MRIALLNLMPDKVRTETQIARVVGSTPLQVEMTLLNTETYKSKNVPERHLIDFYHTWDEVRHEKFDGLIVTGAPIETLPFEAVDYWDELTAILDWSQDHVCRSIHLCWGAQAALHHFHGVPKYELERKMFGIFQHHIVTPGSSLLRGFNDEFSMPVSGLAMARSWTTGSRTGGRPPFLPLRSLDLDPHGNKRGRPHGRQDLSSRSIARAGLSKP